MSGSDVLRIVCSDDPALDLPKCDMPKYWASRDLKHLSYLPGKSPAVYHVRRIPRSLFHRYVKTAHDETTLKVRAFECAVVQVENAYEADGSQRRVPWYPEWGSRKSTDAGVMSDEELSTFPVADVYEVGGVAYDRAFLHPGRESSYSVPRGLHESLAMARRPPVDAVLAALDRSNGESQQGSPTSKEPPSDAPTDATATESATAQE